MGTYIVRRLLIAIPVFFGITMLVFVFVALAPGDAAAAYVRPEFRRRPGRAARRSGARFGLDQPIPIRYVRWLANALQGNLGYRVHRAASRSSSEVFRALQASLLLTGTALFLGMLVGIPLGVLSAVRQYSKIDFFLTGVTFLGISIPSFLLGLGGSVSLGLNLQARPDRGHEHARQTVRPRRLPAAPRPAGLHPRASATRRCSCATRAPRCSRSSTRTTSRRPARRACRAGSSSRATRSGTRSSRSSRSSALSLPEIVGAAVVTEQVFTWPGVGLLMVAGDQPARLLPDHGRGDRPRDRRCSSSTCSPTSRTRTPTRGSGIS